MEEEEKQIQKKNQVDMLHGGLFFKILLFALPLAASSILQQLFNSVDMAVVGRFASSQAQAAVGCNGAVINLLLNLFLGISVGANVLIANYIGSGNRTRIQHAVHTAMLVAVLSGILLLIVGIGIAKPLLVLMDTPEDVLPHAILYLRIYFLGMPFIMVYNFGAAVLRSIGDTKRPLLCLLFSGIINAGLNLVLVIVFHLGVAGVGIATVISNVISAGMVWHFLSYEEEPLRLDWRKLKIAKPEFIKMLRVGVPAGLQSTVFAFANVCIQAALNGYGSDAVAGSSVGLNFEYFTYFAITAFNQTTVTFTSQNFGARKFERCKKVYWQNMLLSTLVTLIMSMTFLLGKDFFISFFTRQPEVAKYAAIRMTYLLTLYIIINTYEITGSALRGMGYSLTPAMLTVFGTCVLRLVWIYTVCKRYTSFEVLMMVYPISWVVTGTAMLICYFVIRKKVFRKAAVE